MPISTGLNRNTIRIGIILPEDHSTTVKLRWPDNLLVASNYDFDDRICLLELSVADNHLNLKMGTEIVHLPELMLATGDTLEGLQPERGITIESVVAGRGFHWEKQIQPILPGRLLFSVVNGNLLLINELSVEAYVACVATSEMGARAPFDLLAAQSIVARCWALAGVEKKHAALNFDVCNDDCCQRYQGTTYLTDHALKAALATEDQVLAFQNTVIDARYSKSCGGIVEDYTNIWGGKPVPYLVPFWDGPDHPEEFAEFDLEPLLDYDKAYCSSRRFSEVNLTAMLGKVDVSGNYYRWIVKVPKTVILSNLKRYYDLDWSGLFELIILKRGASGRIIHLRLAGENEDGDQVTFDLKAEYDVRKIFSESFLYSGAFIIENSGTLEDDDHVVLHGAGWGHGVGLCQIGALGMALEGKSYSEILKHYYPGTTLEVITLGTYSLRKNEG